MVCKCFFLINLSALALQPPLVSRLHMLQAFRGDPSSAAHLHDPQLPRAGVAPNSYLHSTHGGFLMTQPSCSSAFHFVVFPHEAAGPQLSAHLFEAVLHLMTARMVVAVFVSLHFFIHVTCPAHLCPSQGWPRPS